MNHKTLVRIALVMVVVFGVISILYPRIFAPKSPITIEKEEVHAPTLAPVEAPTMPTPPAPTGP